MDDSSMKICYEKILVQYFVSFKGKSLLVSDDLTCHKQPVFDNKLSEVNTVRTEVPQNTLLYYSPVT